MNSKKKYDYYRGFYGKLRNDDNTFKWNASFELSGLKNCYIISYEDIIDNKTKKELLSGTYNIKLISKDFIILSNGYVIKRFEDELTSLNEEFVNIDKKFKKEVTKVNLQPYKHALLDFAYSKYPKKILDYYSNFKEIKIIENLLLIASNDLSLLKDDDNLAKNVKKEKIKKINSEIKDHKKQIKILKKTLNKNFEWNDFDFMVKELQLKVKDIDNFHHEEYNSEINKPKYNGKYDFTFDLINDWKVQLENYKIKQAELKKKQDQIEKEKRKKREEEELLEDCYSIILNCPSNPKFMSPCYQCKSIIELDYLNKLVGD